MRAVIQRTSSALVTIAGKQIARTGRGILVLVGIEDKDARHDMEYIIRKSLTLRIFENENGKMDLSVGDLDFDVLVVPQFTLLGDARRSRRPDFGRAGSVEAAHSTWEELMDLYCSAYDKVQFGQFQAYMEVSLVNDGPVTILLDSRKEF